jgi:hypothetical protein
MLRHDKSSTHQQQQQQELDAARAALDASYRADLG